ncbi:RWDD3 [Scenedesmus sp. PABB004]|nr:RWDD3 [Scenedesmus sp. PABB004]
MEPAELALRRIHELVAVAALLADGGVVDVDPAYAAAAASCAAGDAAEPAAARLAGTGCSGAVELGAGAARGAPAARLAFAMPPAYPGPGAPLRCHVTSQQLPRGAVDELSRAAQARADAAAGAECLHELAEALAAQLADLEQQRRTAADGQPGGGAASGCSPAALPVRRRVLLRLDHMRERAAYTRTIRQWAAELRLSGWLLFWRSLILIELEGDRASVSEYLSRARTVCVDVDASGRKCRERMLSVLADGDAAGAAPGGARAGFAELAPATLDDVLAALAPTHPDLSRAGACVARPTVARRTLRAVVVRSGNHPSLGDIKAVEDKVAEAIKEAEATCADNDKAHCAAAWDNVEELSAAAAHKKVAYANDPVSSDPLEQFCDDNPDADECRVYTSAMLATSNPLRLSGGQRLEVLRAPATKKLVTSKPPLLFVHGSYHGAWCWAERFQPYFADAGYESWAVSLRAQGRSDPAPPGAKVAGTLDSHAADLAEVVAAMDAPPVMVHPGHGAARRRGRAGGRRWGDAAPAFGAFPRLAGAAFLASVPPSGNRDLIFRWLRRDLGLSWRVTWAFVGKSFAKSVDEAVYAFFSDDLPPADAARYQAQLAACSPTRLLDLRDMQAQVPLPRPDPASAPPAFVLGGLDDKVLDEQAFRELAEAYGVEAVVLPGLAHDVMLDTRWQAAADSLRGWLDATAF